MVDDEAPVTTDEAQAAPGAVTTVPTMSSGNVELLARVVAAIGADAIIETAETFGDLVVRVAPSAWRATAAASKQQLGCDYLSFISGIDWMPAPLITEEGSGDTSTPAQPRTQTYGVAGSSGRFQVFARVASTRVARYGITFKVDVDADDPRLDSWVSVYPGADWHERECWEMYGVVFDGHPALRHIYLPSEFEGNPLRKDYALLAREVKPWPGLVDVEPMPGEAGEGDVPGEAVEADDEAAAES